MSAPCIDQARVRRPLLRALFLSALLGCGQPEAIELSHQALIEMAPAPADEVPGVKKEGLLSAVSATELKGFSIPDALVEKELRYIIPDTARAVSVLGSVPTGVDFSKEFLLIYAAGKQPTGGYRLQMGGYVDATISSRPDPGIPDSYIYTLAVSIETLFDPPGTGCAAPSGATRPFILMRVDKTRLRDADKVTRYYLSYTHKSYNRSCTTPGPACSGALSAAGIAELRKRPGGTAPMYSSLRSHAQHLLGGYQMERWTRDCSRGICSWVEIPRKGWCPNYMEGGELFFYENVGVQHLVGFSFTYGGTFHSSSGHDYPLYDWAEATYAPVNVMAGKGDVRSFNLRGFEKVLIASAGYSNEDIGFNGFSGVLGDHCARLSTSAGPVGAHGEVLTVLGTTW